MEQSGVPVLTEDGKGYTLMEGYRILPVMFTEKQANALILAEQLKGLFATLTIEMEATVVK